MRLLLVTLGLTLLCVAVHLHASEVNSRDESAFSSIHVGEKVLVQSVGSNYEIHVVSSGTHEVVRRGNHYILMNEPGNVRQILIPITSVKAIIFYR